MFSFFKKFSLSMFELDDRDRTSADSDITIIDSEKMSLDERKAWRIHIVKRAVHEVFLSFKISGSMYKYRIIPLDERSHFFVVLVETTKHFALSEFAKTSKLSAIEARLKAVINKNYGIIIDSVYWNATETVDIFEKASSKPLPRGKSNKTIEDLRKTFSDIESAPDSIISEEEYTAFKNALTDGKKPQVDGKEYDTDLLPLDPK